MIALVKEAHRPADPIRCHIPPGRIAHGTIWWISIPFLPNTACSHRNSDQERSSVPCISAASFCQPRGRYCPYFRTPSAGYVPKTADHSTMTQSRTSCSSAGRMLLSASPLYSPDGCLQGRKKNPAAQCRPATRQIRRLSSRGTLWHGPAADGAPSGASQAGTFPDPAHDFSAGF